MTEEKKAMSNAERQRLFRKNKREAGHFMMTVWLSPGNAKKLEAMTSKLDLPKQQAREKIINELLDGLF